MASNQVANHILSVDPTYFDNGVLILAPKGHIIDSDGNLNKEALGKINTEFPEGWGKFTQASFKKKITKNLYHALGGVLHVETLRQTEKGVSLEKQKRVCAQVLEAIEERLVANVGTIALWQSLAHKCEDCGTKNIYSYLQTPDSKAKLFNCINPKCAAEYAAQLIGANEYSITPYGRVCQCHGCGEHYIVWRRLFLIGSDAPCPSCGKQHKVGIGNVPVDTDESVRE